MGTGTARAQCPSCWLAIRVESGRFVNHSFVTVTGQPRECPGTGAPVLADTRPGTQAREPGEEDGPPRSSLP